jgi:hypothetical protein
MQQWVVTTISTTKLSVSNTQLFNTCIKHVPPNMYVPTHLVQSTCKDVQGVPMGHQLLRD